MSIANILPQENDLALKIELNTIINNSALDDPELFDVTGPSFSIPEELIDFGYSNLIERGPSVKMINLIPQGANLFLLSIYYPKASDPNYLYLVPTMSNWEYEGGYQDLSTSDDLDIVINIY